MIFINKIKYSIVFFFIISAISCEKQELIVFVDVSSEILTSKHYIVAKATHSIIIDGIADEQNWKTANYSTNFIDIEGIKTPKYDTKFKMLWDQKYLYVYAEMEEPHIWGNITEYDAVIFLNNDFEVFIDPSRNTKNYVEIEINALGTVWDLILDKPYRHGATPIANWNLTNLKSAVKIYGTLNNPSDIDSLWTVEMAIPIDAIMELKNKPKSLPKEGEQWSINFSRVEWDFEIVNGQYQRKKENEIYLKEYNWVWSPQYVINMHEPEKWGTLQFTSQISAKNISYKEDKTFIYKQVTYALMRNTIKGNYKKILETSISNPIIFKVKYSKNDTLYATFYKTNFGFEYELEIPNSNRSLIINQTGNLKFK